MPSARLLINANPIVARRVVLAQFFGAAGYGTGNGSLWTEMDRTGQAGSEHLELTSNMEEDVNHLPLSREATVPVSYDGAATRVPSNDDGNVTEASGEGTDSADSNAAASAEERADFSRDNAAAASREGPDISGGSAEGAPIPAETNITESSQRKTKTAKAQVTLIPNCVSATLQRVPEQWDRESLCPCLPRRVGESRLGVSKIPKWIDPCGLIHRGRCRPWGKEWPWH